MNTYEAIFLHMPIFAKRMERPMQEAIRTAHDAFGYTPEEFVRDLTADTTGQRGEGYILPIGKAMDPNQDPYRQMDLRDCLKYLCCGGLRITGYSNGEPEFAKDQDTFFAFFGVDMYYTAPGNALWRRRLCAGDVGRALMHLYRMLFVQDETNRESLCSREDLEKKLGWMITALQPLCDTQWEHQEICVQLQRELVEERLRALDGEAMCDLGRCCAEGIGMPQDMTEADQVMLLCDQSHDRNLIVTATKSRIVWKYKPLLERRGYRVEILDFSNLKNCTVGYDPLKFVRSQEDVIFLARSIVMADPRKKGNTHVDPYWDEATISLLSALIGLVQLRGEEQAPCFADVIRQCQRLRVNYTPNNIRTNLDLDFQGLEFGMPGNPASANWESFCHLPPRTAACVTGMLNTCIGHLFNADLLDMMRLPQQVDFERFARERTVLFVVTSPVNPALSSLISLFYATAMKELFELAEHRAGGVLPIPVHMVCDDFATGAPIPDFAQYISIVREKGLSITLLCQSESQLESIYSPSEATTIINNCDSYVFTGGMDLQTARNVSLRLNAPVDEVLAMPLGTFAVFRRGERPVLARRYPILDDPEYQQLVEPERFDTLERSA